MIYVAVISFRAMRFQHYSIFFIILYRIIWKSSSFSPLFTEYSSQLWQCISFERYLLKVAKHFERNYQELWRNHVETKRPNDGVVYNEFLFICERMKLTQTIVTNETVRRRNKTSFLFNFFVRFFFNEWSRSRWIKLTDLESRAEIKLIIIIFRSESMTFTGADQKFQT